MSMTLAQMQAAINKAGIAKQPRTDSLIESVAVTLGSLVSTAVTSALNASSEAAAASSAAKVSYTYHRAVAKGVIVE